MITLAWALVFIALTLGEDTLSYVRGKEKHPNDPRADMLYLGVVVLVLVMMIATSFR